MRTPKIDFANFLTLLLTVDGPHTIPLHSWMYRDFLPVVSNSIPLPQELRIEGEIHEVPSPRPELEGRATPESPNRFSSLRLAKQTGVSLSIHCRTSVVGTRGFGQGGQGGAIYTRS